MDSVTSRISAASNLRLNLSSSEVKRMIINGTWVTCNQSSYSVTTSETDKVALMENMTWGDFITNSFRLDNLGHIDEVLGFFNAVVDISTFGANAAMENLLHFPGARFWTSFVPRRFDIGLLKVVIRKAVFNRLNFRMKIEFDGEKREIDIADLNLEHVGVLCSCLRYWSRNPNLGILDSEPRVESDGTVIGHCLSLQQLVSDVKANKKPRYFNLSRRMNINVMERDIDLYRNFMHQGFRSASTTTGLS